MVQKVMVLDLLWVMINFLFSAGYYRRPENFQLGKKSTLFQILYGEQNYIFATVVIGLIIKIVVFLT